MNWLGRRLSLMMLITHCCAWAADDLGMDDATIRTALKNVTVDTQAYSPSAPLSAREARMSADLRNLLASRGKDRRAQSPFLARSMAGGPGSPEKVNVIITAPRADTLTKLRQQLGASGTTIGDKFYASVATADLDALAQNDAVQYIQLQGSVSLPPNYRFRFQGKSSRPDGIEAINAKLLHGKGITGKGVKVGILDFGFAGYSELKARDQLPDPAGAQAFNVRNDMTGAGVAHGTGVAEIIHAVAPDAKLYLASVGLNGHTSDQELINGIRWLADQGVDIINFSGGGQAVAHDGSAMQDQLVNSLVERGILWVNASGNEGDNHFATLTADDNGNGWIDVPGSKVGDFVVFKTSGKNVRLLANWDAWQAEPGRPRDDVDLYLFRVEQDGNATEITRSVISQRNGELPLEIIEGRFPAGVYAIGMRNVKLTGRRPIHLYLEGDVDSFYPKTARGSISSPGTAARALTVGAITADSLRLERFSSQGPTDDQRNKPELVAPDGVRSAAFELVDGHAVFQGTSAAAPHAAGFAALLKQLNPARRGEQLKADVIEATSLMDHLPNNSTGSGVIDASKVARNGGNYAPPGAREALKPLIEMLR